MGTQQHVSSQAPSQVASQGARGAAYSQFCEVAGIAVDHRVVDAIVEHETAAAVRAFVDTRNANGLKRLLVGYATRATITIIQANHVLPAHVAQAIRDVGWPAYEAALRGTVNDARNQLTRWLKAAAITVQEAASNAGTDQASAALVPPPAARLPPPPASASRVGPRAPLQSHREAPAGAINTAARPRPAVPAQQASPAAAREPTHAQSPTAPHPAARAPSAPRDELPQACNAPEQAPREYAPKEHIYNKGRDPSSSAIVARAALCVEAVVDRNGNQTLKFEGAGPHPTDRERYHWQEKIIFYATPDEAQKILCVLLGYLDEASFNNHGENNDKYLKLKRQDDSFYCTLGEGQARSVAVKIPPANATRVAVLALLQFKRASHGLDESILHMILARVTAPLSKAADAKRAMKTGGRAAPN